MATLAGEIRKIIVARLLKEGIDLAVLTKMLKGYPFKQEAHSCLKNSVNAPTKHRVRPDFFDYIYYIIKL